MAVLSSLFLGSRAETKTSTSGVELLCEPSITTLRCVALVDLLVMPGVVQTSSIAYVKTLRTIIPASCTVASGLSDVSCGDSVVALELCSKVPSLDL